MLTALIMLLNVFSLNAGADELPLNSSGVPNRALSVDPVEHSEGYSAVLYDNTNGLPTSEANAIVETSEGFIWIGSYAGLIRYDGNTFQRLDSTGCGSVRMIMVSQSWSRVSCGHGESWTE